MKLKGLELSELYWNDVGKPLIMKTMPELFEYAAFGMAGEGSENWGADDEISKDHDWGPGFCIWMSNDNMKIWGDKAKYLYNELPKEYKGYKSEILLEQNCGRKGLINEDVFLLGLIKAKNYPHTLFDWMNLSETGLSAACNGKIFMDNPGLFSKKRKILKEYYPEDVRLKKLAGRCALAAQSGQYNYERCVKRNDDVGAMLCLSLFIEHIQAAVFILNKEYKPYYKLANRVMKNLPILGSRVSELFSQLLRTPDKVDMIEFISSIIIDELTRQGLTDINDDYLFNHAIRIQMKIKDISLKSQNLLLY